MKPPISFCLAALLVGIAAPLTAAKPKKPRAEVAISPEWDDRGVDTTQPQWYRTHPFWKIIEKPFRKQCDSLFARLNDSLPATPDSIVRRAEGMIPGFPDSLAAETYPAAKRGLILRPQLLRSSPLPGGTPVGVIRPEGGPWRVIAIYSPKGTPYPPLQIDRSGKERFQRMGRSLEHYDRVTEPGEVLRLRYPGYKALVATIDRKRLGWIPVDSMAIFQQADDAIASAPFYQDGIAAFVHGMWLNRSSTGGKETPDQALMTFGNLELQDMIHLWKVTIVAEGFYDLKNIPTQFLHCRIFDREPNGKTWVWLNDSCVRNSDIGSFPLSYFYDHAGWEKFQRIRRITVSGSRIDKWYGFSLRDTLGFRIGGYIDEEGYNSDWMRFPRALAP